MKSVFQVFVFCNEKDGVASQRDKEDLGWEEYVAQAGTTVYLTF